MPKLITLGCSVTSNCGVNEALSSLLNLENLNLSYPAGSNQLQISRLMELIVNDKISKDDIIYWQITNTNRDYLRLKMSFKNTAKKIQQENFEMPYHHYIVSEIENVFDNEKRIDILCNSPLLEKISYSFDEEEELQKLLGIIILLKKFCDKIIVSFGWRGALTLKQEAIFKRVLSNNDIEYVEDRFVDFSINRKLPMMDDRHPSIEAGKIYAKEVLFKKMKLLGWT